MAFVTRYMLNVGHYQGAKGGVSDRNFADSDTFRPPECQPLWQEEEIGKVSGWDAFFYKLCMCSLVTKTVSCFHFLEGNQGHQVHLRFFCV